MKKLEAVIMILAIVLAVLETVDLILTLQKLHWTKIPRRE